MSDKRIIPTPLPPTMCMYEDKPCRHPQAEKIVNSTLRTPNPAFTMRLKQDLFCTPCLRIRIVRSLESIANNLDDKEFK